MIFLLINKNIVTGKVVVGSWFLCLCSVNYCVIHKDVSFFLNFLIQYFYIFYVVWTFLFVESKMFTLDISHPLMWNVVDSCLNGNHTKSPNCLHVWFKYTGFWISTKKTKMLYFDRFLFVILFTSILSKTIFGDYSIDHMEFWCPNIDRSTYFDFIYWLP